MLTTLGTSFLVVEPVEGVAGDGLERAVEQALDGRPEVLDTPGRSPLGRLGPEFREHLQGVAVEIAHANRAAAGFGNALPGLF